MRIHVTTLGRQPYHSQARASFVDLAKLDVVGRHHVEEDPSRADAILFIDLQQHPQDPLLKTLRSHPMARQYADKVRVYDERDFPSYTFPGIYIGAPSAWGRRLPVVGGPYATLWNPVSRAEFEPDLLFSFRGARTHRVRDDVLRLSHERGVVETDQAPFPGPPDKAGTRAEAYKRYADLVQRSKFVLCPRGHGPSSFRIYETLRAERVPVVISDDWLPPPRVTWASSIVRIRERDVRRVPQILEERESEWAQLLADGRAARIECSQARLWDHYAESLDSLRPIRRHRPQLWWTQPRAIRIQLRVIRMHFRRRESMCGRVA
jgi:hypothetical protein